MQGLLNYASTFCKPLPSAATIALALRQFRRLSGLVAVAAHFAWHAVAHAARPLLFECGTRPLTHGPRGRLRRLWVLAVL